MAIKNLDKALHINKTCGYITFIKTGVMDLGCQTLEDGVFLSNSHAFESEHEIASTV